MTDDPVAAAIARVDLLAGKLRRGSGPNYPALASIVAEVEMLKTLKADSPIAEIVDSLSKVAARPLHDHPKFIDLIEAHVSALKLAATGGPQSVGADGGAMLLAELYAATQKIFDPRRS